MMKKGDFGRLITAMVTPFSADLEVNYAAAVDVAEYLVENGTDTVLLTGTTGESPTLTHDEEFELFRIIVRHFKGKIPIMAGTGSNCTRTAIRATQEAESLGISGSLQVVPYYNKPSQEGLFQHFKTVASATSLPILLYNVPSRTSRNLEPETVARLAEIPNIVGLKEAGGSLEQFEKIRALVPSTFRLYSGDDGFTYDFMQRGAYGVVSVASHIAGKQIQEMLKLLAIGNANEARIIQDKLAPLFEVLFITTNPVPVKAAMRALGFAVGGPRLPLVDVTSEERQKIEGVLDQLFEVKH